MFAGELCRGRCYYQFESPLFYRALMGLFWDIISENEREIISGELLLITDELPPNDTELWHEDMATNLTTRIQMADKEVIFINSDTVASHNLTILDIQLSMAQELAWIIADHAELFFREYQTPQELVVPTTLQDAGLGWLRASDSMNMFLVELLFLNWEAKILK